jgi:TusA-related sulfurtransferase
LPIPLIQTREHTDIIEGDEVWDVMADYPAVEEDIKRSVGRNDHGIGKFEKKEGCIRFLIKKSN